MSECSQYASFNMLQVLLSHSLRDLFRTTWRVTAYVDVIWLEKGKTYVPILSAPATNIALQASNERTPPEALTFTPPLYLTARYMRLTSSFVAPHPAANPVHVFTNAAPASAAKTDAAILSSSVGISPVSRITLTGTEPAALTMVSI